MRKPNYNTIIKRTNGNELYAYVIYGMFTYMKEGMNAQDAFFNSCDDENIYGDRDDIVQVRKNIANILNYHYNIIVNHDFSDPSGFSC